jgi:hypothetical protein
VSAAEEAGKNGTVAATIERSAWIAVPRRPLTTSFIRSDMGTMPDGRRSAKEVWSFATAIRTIPFCGNIEQVSLYIAQQTNKLQWR